MSYLEIPDTDVDLDSPLDEDLFERFRDNIRACRQTVFGWTFAEVSDTTASPSWGTMTTQYLVVPELALWSGRTRRIELIVEAKTSAGATGCKLRLNQASGTPTEVAIATSTSYADYTLEVDSLPAQYLTFTIEGQVASGTVYARLVDRSSGLLEF